MDRGRKGLIAEDEEKNGRTHLGWVTIEATNAEKTHFHLILGSFLRSLIETL